ncbi:hypothetical protein CHLNCDRAFT_138767 [Chlorella variabilis]|uniref:Uncharacterized protein n=1 Tax=Chlorella variabilis TaxID=554065 RepID=E1ZNQ0_CHLVA|nr:hypothetical protein CHLNCDRAFT_138767 [Chlorella variabilis]EFN52454.1 hypothetical protein CHLNCDRAFT_138767 [Chlorella variabilis]|eukprot:XP_005844556.1 hypothetical protein CHLNCDRAFT_138767 [Chlorella variabilis]
MAQPPLELPAGLVLPRMGQALEWANALLDATLVKLSHEPEAQPLVEELHQVVDQQAAEARPLLRLSGALAQLLEQQQQQQQSRLAAHAADYSVQWLDLRILAPEQRDQPGQ